ncbi:MAG: cytochrome P450 [Mycobacterium sp.]|nr:cytochrome P450 [Mycobacterium sp.]
MDAATAWAEAMKFANRPNPYPFFDELRRTPVAKVSERTYVVTGYDEVIALTSDPRISSDAFRSPAGLWGEKPETHGAAGEGGGASSFIGADPAIHDRMRRQCMRFFGPPHTPDLIPSMESYVVDMANDLLDTVKARGGTRMDMVDDFAYPIPVSVICKILGVPVEDVPTFHPWIFDFMQGADIGPEALTEEGRERTAKSVAGVAKLKDYLAELTEGYAREPGPGLISAILHDTDGPDGPMPVEEVVPNAMLLLFAGHDSTVNTMSHCVLTLLRNPGAWDLLVDNPELIPRMIEEVQRLQSAVQFFPSFSAPVDIEIAGTTIKAGSAVHLMYGAANRDPRKFPDPDRFDLNRKNRGHLGWGSGIRVCFGGPLARLEVNAAMEVFLRRVRNPRLVADPPPYRRNQVFRGPLHLALDFDEIV